MISDPGSRSPPWMTLNGSIALSVRSFPFGAIQRPVFDIVDPELQWKSLRVWSVLAITSVLFSSRPTPR